MGSSRCHTSARNITQLLAIEPGVSADVSELLSNDNASISPSVNTDEDFSGFLYSSQNARPSLAPGMTLDDQTTDGSVEERVDAYLNRDAFVSSGEQFGTLGRNSVVGPSQQRLDISLAKITPISGRTSLELRLETYNLFNTTAFRNPVSNLSDGNFGQITWSRGDPRLVQLGAKLRF